MRLGVTGTPGVGKTTFSVELAGRLGLETIHLDDMLVEEGLFRGRDWRREAYIVDMDRFSSWIRGRVVSPGVYEGLSIIYNEDSEMFDKVIVLRCDPYTLEERLLRRGYSREKVAENLEAEILDIVYAEAVDIYGEEKVIQIDNSGSLDVAVDRAIHKIVSGGECDIVDWLELIMSRGDVRRFLE